MNIAQFSEPTTFGLSEAVFRIKCWIIVACEHLYLGDLNWGPANDVNCMLVESTVDKHVHDPRLCRGLTLGPLGCWRVVIIIIVPRKPYETKPVKRIHLNQAYLMIFGWYTVWLYSTYFLSTSMGDDNLVVETYSSWFLRWCLRFWLGRFSMPAGVSANSDSPWRSLKLRPRMHGWHLPSWVDMAMDFPKLEGTVTTDLEHDISTLTWQHGHQEVQHGAL